MAKQSVYKTNSIKCNECGIHFVLKKQMNIDIIRISRRCYVVKFMGLFTSGKTKEFALDELGSLFHDIYNLYKITKESDVTENHWKEIQLFLGNIMATYSTSNFGVIESTGQIFVE